MKMIVLRAKASYGCEVRNDIIDKYVIETDFSTQHLDI